MWVVVKIVIVITALVGLVAWAAELQRRQAQHDAIEVSA